MITVERGILQEVFYYRTCHKMHGLRLELHTQTPHPVKGSLFSDHVGGRLTVPDVCSLHLETDTFRKWTAAIIH